MTQLGGGVVWSPPHCMPPGKDPKLAKKRGEKNDDK